MPPHAQPQPQKRVRSLRIGVILGGKITEEKLVRAIANKKETVTLGQSAKNTFSVPIESLPRTWPLFHVANGRYTLNFTEAMGGRVSDGNAIYTIDQLKAGPARKHSNGYSLPLADTARGKMTLGELTILFQFVTAPPVQPRPKLPHSVRGTFADRIDPVLTSIMSVSVLAHGIFAWWLYQRDVEAKTKLEVIAQSQNIEPERQSELFVMPEKPIEKPAIAEAGTDEPKEGDKPKGGDKAKGPKKPKEGGGGEEEPAGGGPPSDASLQDEIEDTAVMRVLTGGGSATGEGRYSEMTGKDAGGDLDKSLANVSRGGGKVTSRGAGGLGNAARGGSGEIGTGEDTGVEGPGDTGRVGDPKEDTQIRSRTDVGSVDSIDETSLDPPTVAKTIKTRYLKGVRRCHENLLKVDPSAGGRIEIEITVGAQGNVVKAKVTGFDESVDTCIKTLANQWRFPKPVDEDGEATTATFILPFVLKAGG
jgi:hypothetical protein